MHIDDTVFFTETQKGLEDTMSKRVLAFDFGASSGRAIIGEYANGKITLNEVHRFDNSPVMLGGTYYWDVLRLFHEIKQGILAAKAAGGFDTIGIDTWGVDFGLIGKDGRLLENPIHYRDRRTEGMPERADELIPRGELYSRTGIQIIYFNTIYQLLSLKEKRPELLERTDKVLFMPDLFGYFLTGNMTSEYSIATTSGLVNLKTGDWDKEIFGKLGIDAGKMCPIAPSGSVLGNLRKEICDELGVPPVPVISVCGHDTQSAVTAVPTATGDFAFISSGTWSLFGTEIESPITSDAARSFNITNEGGYGYSIAFLKNIAGLWLIQESRRQYRREGKEYSYADLERLALEAEPDKFRIDPDDGVFAPPGDMPGRIRDYCEKDGQGRPETVGEVIRCIYESLAAKYKYVLGGIENCTGKKFDKIHVVGGGTKDGLLCRMTADVCGLPVYAGPVEATVLGNVAVQLLSSGELADIAEARKVIADSFELKQYYPK